MKYPFRLLCLALALVLLTPLFAACKKKGAKGEREQEEALDENEIAVTWHAGAIRSDKMPSKAGQVDESVAGYAYSDVITIPKEGTKLTFTDEGDTAGAEYYVLSHWRQDDTGAWVLEDPGDHYAGGATARTATYLATTADGVTTYAYVTEKNNENVRLCYRVGQETGKYAKVYLTKTSDTPTLLLQKDTQHYKDLRLGQYGFTEKNYPELAGKTVYIMGDSYFNDYLYAFGKDMGKPSPYNLPNLVAKKYGMTLTNYAKSGSSISAYNTDYNPMCRRIDQMGAGSPDIVILEGGRNDFWAASAPLGTLYTGSGEERQLSMDETTFYGAVNSCIAQLKEKYPNAMIIGMTCWSVTRVRDDRVTQNNFADAMVKAFAANGLPCINAAGFSVVRMDDADFRAAYCRDDTDISHMNIDGMVLTAPTFEKKLGQAYRQFLAAK